jgi:hypothetical protein
MQFSGKVADNMFEFQNGLTVELSRLFIQDFVDHLSELKAK